MGTGTNANTNEQGPPDVASYEFGAAFGETFDFGSFSTSDPPLAPKASQATTNGASAFLKTEPPTDISFDDAFGTLNITPDKGKRAPPLSFDDAFNVGSIVPEPRPQPLAQPQPTPGFPIPEPSSASTTITVQAPTPRQYQETPSDVPTTPPGPSSQAPVSIRSASPSPTQQSTQERMQRTVSSKPRSSIHIPGSSKTSGSQSEPPPTKTSRFHLFGRSKTKKEKDKAGKDGKGRGGDIPPVPNMPARLVGDRGDAPAPDDLDAVKQLCGMGFSRHQAVEALEKHDYNFNAALNSLLEDYNFNAAVNSPLGV
jgi:epidermal growth factor receptor substrate 15